VKALALIQARSDVAAKVQVEQVLVLAADGSAADAVTGASAPLSDTAEDAVVNNRLRSACCRAPDRPARPSSMASAGWARRGATNAGPLLRKTRSGAWRSSCSR